MHMHVNIATLNWPGGVSAEILKLADHCIEIPSDGLGGSINLATAAAIVMYQAARKLPLT